jgi:hypothetical protein
VTKKELILAVAKELYEFNHENLKWKVKDTFSVDGKEYSIQKEVTTWLKAEFNEEKD